MAQQVVIAGALFNDVPSISVPDSNSVYHPFVDPSVTTAAASDVAQGKQFIAADGTLTQGTASGGGGGIGTLLKTESLGNINYTSTSAGSLSKTITVNNVETYDMLMIAISRDSKGNSKHYSTLTSVFLLASTDISTKITISAVTPKWNAQHQRMACISVRRRLQLLEPKNEQIYLSMQGTTRPILEPSTAAIQQRYTVSIYTA